MRISLCLGCAFVAITWVSLSGFVWGLGNIQENKLAQNNIIGTKLCNGKKIFRITIF